MAEPPPERVSDLLPLVQQYLETQRQRLALNARARERDAKLAETEQAIAAAQWRWQVVFLAGICVAFLALAAGLIFYLTEVHAGLLVLSHFAALAAGALAGAGWAIRRSTSNIFAVLGMRSLCFALSGIIPFFHYLHRAFAGILVFAGIKMLLAEVYEIPDGAALGVVGGLLFVAMVGSVVRPRESQIEALLAQGTATGQFDEAEAKLVERVFHFGDRRVGSLMTPRPEIVWLDPGDSREELARKVSRAAESQFLVARGSLDEVIGVVHAKDLLASLLARGTLDLVAAARRPLYVPQHMPALKVLELFKDQLGRFPTPGDRFEWRNLRFEIVEMEGRRVGKLRVTRVEREPAGAE